MPRLKSLSGAEVKRILERHGFELVRQRGSHMILRLNQAHGDSRTVPVPTHSEIAPGTLRSIIDLSGLSSDLFSHRTR